MSDWFLIIYCGLITYLTRFSMIALLKKEMFNDRIREILSYVPFDIQVDFKSFNTTTFVESSVTFLIKRSSVSHSQIICKLSSIC